MLVDSHLKYKVTSTKTNSLFSIGEIQASDIGNFTCVAENDFGMDSKTENVYMEGKDKLVWNLTEMWDCSFHSLLDGEISRINNFYSYTRKMSVKRNL